MEFDERLSILRDGGIISAEAEKMTRDVITRMDEKWGIKLTGEGGERLVTHLAMALMRIAANEPVNALESEELDEFRENRFFDKSVEITDDICTLLPQPFPASERDFLIINICVISEMAHGD